MREQFPKSSNTSNQARADVSARVLWIKGQMVFCDVSVFNPVARCHLHHRLLVVHKKMKTETSGSITTKSFKWNMDHSQM